MANAKLSVITNNGLNKVNEWGAGGSHFTIKYFLPVYDPSIDETIHSNTQALTSGIGTDVKQLSASIPVTVSEVSDIQGEKLYNASSELVQLSAGVSESSAVYTVTTDDNFFILSANNVECGPSHSGSPSSAATYVSATSQNIYGRINLAGSSSISEAISGNEWTYTSATPLSGSFFTGTSVAGIQKYEEPTWPSDHTSATGMLYPVLSYAPVDISADIAGIDAGRYTIQLDQTVGTFKFNKIIFFIQKVDANGNEDTSVLPVPFSQTVFEGTQTKETGFESGGDSLVWEGIVDLIFQRTTLARNLTYLAWDEWATTSNFGLYTARDVAIGSSAIANSHETSAARLSVYSDGTNRPHIALKNHSVSADGILSAGNGNVLLSAYNNLTLDGGGSTIYLNDPVSANGNVSATNFYGNFIGTLTDPDLSATTLTVASTAGISGAAFLGATVNVTGNAVFDSYVNVGNTLTVSANPGTIAQFLDINNATLQNASTDADEVIIDSGETDMGMTLMGTANCIQRIHFYSSGAGALGQIKFDHTVPDYNLRINGESIFTATSGDYAFNKPVYFDIFKTTVVSADFSTEDLLISAGNDVIIDGGGSTIYLNDPTKVDGNLSASSLYGTSEPFNIWASDAAIKMRIYTNRVLFDTVPVSITQDTSAADIYAGTVRAKTGSNLNFYDAGGAAVVTISDSQTLFGVNPVKITSTLSATGGFELTGSFNSTGAITASDININNIGIISAGGSGSDDIIISGVSDIKLSGSGSTDVHGQGLDIYSGGFNVYDGAAYFAEGVSQAAGQSFSVANVTADNLSVYNAAGTSNGLTVYLDDPEGSTVAPANMTNAIKVVHDSGNPCISLIHQGSPATGVKSAIVMGGDNNAATRGGTSAFSLEYETYNSSNEIGYMIINFNNGDGRASSPWVKVIHEDNGVDTLIKTGWYGATPVYRQTSAGDDTEYTAGGASLIYNDTTFNGGTGNIGYTIGDIVLALKNYGLLQSSL